MPEFARLVSEALKLAGLPDADTSSARRAISEIEQTTETVESFIGLIESLKSRYSWAFSRIVGRPVRKLLIAPVPPYLEPALAWIVAEIPEVVLADNHRAGEMIAGRVCLPIAEAQAGPEGFDAYLLGTIRSRYARFFRDQFPEALTIGAWDLRQSGSASILPRTGVRGGAELLEAIEAADKPIVVLAYFPDATLASTYQALADEGFDVLLAMRHSDTSVGNETPPTAFHAPREFYLNYSELIEVLETNKRAPVIINYQRIFSSHFDLENCLYLMAYSLSIIRITSSCKILHLYDLYNLCVRGFSMEAPVFKLYEAMLSEADAIICNSDPFDVFDKYIQSGKPIIPLLRYPPRSESLAKAEKAPFSIAMITGFLGEHDDPTRMTEKAVRSLLRQGAHIHYYSKDPKALTFQRQAQQDYPGLFHLHPPIAIQSELVREISRYDAGWFVINMWPFSNLEANYVTPFARNLARVFNLSCCGTAGLLYGAAGLPIFTYRHSYVSRLYAAGAAFEVELTEDGDLVGGRVPIDEVNWAQARARASKARESFFMDQHIAPCPPA